MRQGVDGGETADGTMSEDHGSTLDRTLHEVVLYPPHPPRKATKRYRDSHKRLIKTLDLPCLVCGVRNSTLKDPKENPCGAKQIETHHRLIEDSLANAIDVEKFNRKILPSLLKKSGDAEKYGHPFTREEMIDWIHGDEMNLWCICDVHHRHPQVGTGKPVQGT